MEWNEDSYVQRFPKDSTPNRVVLLATDGLATLLAPLQ